MKEDSREQEDPESPDSPAVLVLELLLSELHLVLVRVEGWVGQNVLGLLRLSVEKGQPE